MVPFMAPIKRKLLPFITRSILPSLRKANLKCLSQEMMPLKGLSLSGLLASIRTLPQEPKRQPQPTGKKLMSENEKPKFLKFPDIKGKKAAHSTKMEPSVCHGILASAVRSMSVEGADTAQIIGILEHAIAELRGSGPQGTA